MILSPIKMNTSPISAIAVDGEVVIFCTGPRPIDASFAPEAILASLEGLRLAAERALAQRQEPK